MRVQVATFIDNQFVKTGIILKSVHQMSIVTKSVWETDPTEKISLYSYFSL